MDRRTLLRNLAAVSLMGIAARGYAQAGAKGAIKVEELQKNWKMLLADGADVRQPPRRLKLADAEWKKRLSPAAYNVLRHEGTERAGTSPLDSEKRAGVFVCAGCGLPLFTSAMKFDSGTGWPSFFTTIPGRVRDQPRFQADPAAHRIPLRALRRPPRPHVRRRPGADRPALLQQRRGAALHSQDRQGLSIAGPWAPDQRASPISRR